MVFRLICRSYVNIDPTNRYVELIWGGGGEKERQRGGVGWGVLPKPEFQPAPSFSLRVDCSNLNRLAAHHHCYDPAHSVLEERAFAFGPGSGCKFIQRRRRCIPCVISFVGRDDFVEICCGSVKVEWVHVKVDSVFTSVSLRYCFIFTNLSFV